ncbi:hypothetical protein BH20ACT23_BH20ACT23_18760 [soil metagenome]
MGDECLQGVSDGGLDRVALGFPRQAPVFVVDDDATETPFGFGMSTYRRQESFSLGIPVFRSGPASGTAEVDFDVVGIGPKPAQANDYEMLTTGPLQFDPGDRVKVIKIKMNKDFASESDEQLEVKLEGDQVGAMGSTEVTIENLSPGSGALRPTGRLHHPKHKYKYPQNYPWLNEIHIFTKSADRELTVKRAEMSIVKKMKNGSCRWWNGERFLNQSASTDVGFLRASRDRPRTTSCTGSGRGYRSASVRSPRSRATRSGQGGGTTTGTPRSSAWAGTRTGSR